MEIHVAKYKEFKEDYPKSIYPNYFINDNF